MDNSPTRQLAKEDTPWDQFLARILAMKNGPVEFKLYALVSCTIIACNTLQ